MSEQPITPGIDNGSQDGNRNVPLSIVVLISGSGTNLQALIDHVAARVLPLRITRVISNRPQAAGLGRARRAGIEAVVVDHQSYEGRSDFELALASAIDAVHPDLIVMAGFMRILEADFVNRYPGRMINLHPSLLPKYRGLHTYQRALESGDAEHGCSVHFVTDELDGGPVIAQARIPILSGDDEQNLKQRLAPVEHRLLVAVTALFAQGRLACNNGCVLLDGNALSHPLVLTHDLQLAIDNSAIAGDHRSGDSG